MSQLEQQPDLDVIKAERISAPSDSLADRENKYLLNDEKRKDGFKGHLHWIIIAAMYIAALFVMILFGIRFWHFAAPYERCWLDKDRLHDIERVIFSSALATSLSFYFKNVLKAVK